ncbi:MAG: DUF2505 domain-containing protein [Nevskiales bacterium]
MDHVIEVRFPFSSDVVIKAFTDKQFHLDKVDALGSSNVKLLDHSDDPDDFFVKISRQMPTEVDVPRALKSLVPATVTVVHKDAWSFASKTGFIEIELSGLPVEVSCDASLRDEGDECVYRYVWHIKAKVPLVGGKLEKLLAADMDEKIPREAEASIPLLAGYQ